jgi:hypothetical protein
MMESGGRRSLILPSSSPATLEGVQTVNVPPWGQGFLVETEGEVLFRLNNEEYRAAQLDRITDRLGRLEARGLYRALRGGWNRTEALTEPKTFRQSPRP